MPRLRSLIALGAVVVAISAAAATMPAKGAGAPEAPPTLPPIAAQAASATPPDAPVTSSTDPRPAQIAAMLAGRPLADYGTEMVVVADRYGIDWRLLPVISFLESGGGVAACGGNAWGFLRCETTFPDYSVGMQRVAQTLAAYPYAGESIATIMCIWQSGGGCSTAPAVDYAYLGAPYYARLGDPIGLPPRISAEAVDEDPAPGPEAAGEEPVVPVAYPTATHTPTGEATPATTPATVVDADASDNEAGAESTPAPSATPAATD